MLFCPCLRPEIDDRIAAPPPGTASDCHRITSPRDAPSAGNTSQKVAVITGLDELGLHVSSLRRLGSRKAFAAVHLKSYDVTAQVRRLKPSERHPYLARRVDAWISALQR